MVYTDAGEDLIASCPVCGYAANTEKATSLLEAVVELEPTGDGAPELIHTPGMGAIADIAAFLKMQPANDIKCVAYMALKRGAGEKADTWHPVAAFLRGDHQVNETKLLGAIGGAELRPMVTEELEQFFHGPAGYLGPVGVKTAAKALGEELTVVVDKSLEGRSNMVCGANKLDYHLRNVTPGKDFSWTLAADIRTVNEGEGCPKDGCAGKLVVGKAVEIGHIFKLGYKYSEAMGARVLDVNGKEVTPIMLRHRHRAHSYLGCRAIERRQRLLAAGLDCAVCRRRHDHQRARCRAFGCWRKDCRRTSSGGSGCAAGRPRRARWREVQRRRSGGHSISH
jgi:prolyl-tRNA synthetase